MGICQNKDNKNLTYTTKSLLDKSPNPTKTHFYFSTEPISKLDGDCLLILANTNDSVKNSAFLKQQKHLCGRIQKEFRGAAQGKYLQDGDLVLFNVFGTSSQYQKVGVIIINEKRYKQQIQSLSKTPISPGQQQPPGFIQEHISSSIESLIKSNIKSIIVTELEWKDKTYKATIFNFICKKVIESGGFKSVVFACLSEQSQTNYMSMVQQYRQQMDHRQSPSERGSQSQQPLRTTIFANTNGENRVSYFNKLYPDNLNLG